MKKTACLLLIVAVVLLLAACTESTYPPVDSTDEESRTVMTVTVDGERYDIKYELYRALFLNFKNEIDGGDASVWSGEEKDTYIERINELIWERVADIYATIHVASEIGIAPYSNEIEDKIQDAITAAIDSEKYGGDYDKYLAMLKENNLNYSTHVLILRYAILLNEIETYYAGDVDDGIYGSTGLGKLAYTEEDVRAFYESDDCVRVLMAFVAKHSTVDAETLRESIKAAGNEHDVGTVMISNTFSAEDLRDGELIAYHNLNKFYYGELTKTAFSLELNETSKVIEIVTGEDENDGRFILYRIDKDEEFLEDCYEDAVYAYVQNEIGKILDNCALELLGAMQTTDALDEIDYSAIGMN